MRDAFRVRIEMCDELQHTCVHSRVLLLVEPEWTSIDHIVRAALNAMYAPAALCDRLALCVDGFAADGGAPTTALRDDEHCVLQRYGFEVVPKSLALAAPAQLLPPAADARDEPTPPVALSKRRQRKLLRLKRAAELAETAGTKAAQPPPRSAPELVCAPADAPTSPAAATPSRAAARKQRRADCKRAREEAAGADEATGAQPPAAAALAERPAGEVGAEAGASKRRRVAAADVAAAAPRQLALLASPERPIPPAAPATPAAGAAPAGGRGGWPTGTGALLPPMGETPPPLGMGRGALAASLSALARFPPLPSLAFPRAHGLSPLPAACQQPQQQPWQQQPSPARAPPPAPQWPLMTLVPSPGGAATANATATPRADGHASSHTLRRVPPPPPPATAHALAAPQAPCRYVALPPLGRPPRATERVAFRAAVRSCGAAGLPTLSAWKEARVLSVADVRLTLCGAASALAEMRAGEATDDGSDGGGGDDGGGEGGRGRRASPLWRGDADDELTVEVYAHDLIDTRLIGAAAAPSADTPAAVAPRSAAAPAVAAALAAPAPAMARAARPSYDKRRSICAQLEFYFSAPNLRKDDFMRKQLAEAASNGGFVPLAVLGTFARIARMRLDEAELVEALRESTALELSDDLLCVRSRPSMAPE